MGGRELRQSCGKCSAGFTFAVGQRMAFIVVHGQTHPCCWHIKCKSTIVCGSNCSLQRRVGRLHAEHRLLLFVIKGHTVHGSVVRRLLGLPLALELQVVAVG